MTTTNMLADIRRWREAGKSFAIARVIRTWGSSPRPVGSALLIGEDGEMTGSVSGGCVEGHIWREAATVLKSGEARMLKYGVSDDEAWQVGLSCGGTVEIFLQRFDSGQPALSAWLSQMEKSGECVWVTALKDGPSTDMLWTPEENSTESALPQELHSQAREAWQQRNHSICTVGDRTYFLQTFSRRPLMLLIGAAHVTTDLVRLAALYDFETVVIDPRGVFAEKTSFPVAPDHLHPDYPSEVLNLYPMDRFTYAVILSHDPKIDDNALHVLLRSNVAYIGALGSRKTHEKRCTRLSAEGFTEAELGRIEAPVGLDIHAQGAGEIALSIMASIIKRKNATR